MRVCVCVSVSKRPEGGKNGRKSVRERLSIIMLGYKEVHSINTWALRSAGATLIDDRLHSKAAIAGPRRTVRRHRRAAAPSFQVLIRRMKHLIPLLRPI